MNTSSADAERQVVVVEEHIKAELELMGAAHPRLGLNAEATERVFRERLARVAPGDLKELDLGAVWFEAMVSTRAIGFGGEEPT